MFIMSRKSKEDYFIEIKKLAKENNIELLSLKYSNNESPLLFKCKNESCQKEWYDSRANIIRRKSGFKCPKCGGGINRHYTIEEMNELASLKPGGGKCVSRHFKGTKKYLIWECFTCGHKWCAKPSDIMGKPSRPQGTWCPECSRSIKEKICRKFFETIFNKEFPKEYGLPWLRQRKMHLDGYSRELNLAFEYQGKQHYVRIPYFHPTTEDFNLYQENDKYKRDMCKKNDINLIEIGYVRNNGNLMEIKFEGMEDYIINECRKVDIIVPSNIEKIDWRKFNIAPPGYLEEIHEIAIMKGGKCLSEYWLGARVKLEFICAENHQFKATPSKIKGTPKRPKGSWCPICKFKNLLQNQLKYTKEYLDKLAILRGGTGSKCLSKEYMGYHAKHKWKCSKGHEFIVRFDSVKGYPSKPKGSWCKKCAIERRKR